MVPSNRTEFREYCLRKLGKNVIEINIDPDQVEDRIDEALDYWRNYHQDAVTKTYLKYQITQDDIDNQWIPMNENLISITRVFPPNGTSGSGNINMFDLRYQIRLNDFNSFLSTDSHLDYYLIRRQLEQIDMFYVGEPGANFTKHMDRINIYWDWQSDISVGDYVIIECEVAIDEDTYTDIWSDRTLQRYATALLKQQWGANLKKFNGVQLLGGITLDGQTIFQEATEEIEKLEQMIKEEFQEPPRFIVG